MTLPTFLVIGAAKSGTTSLHRYLASHPEVFMSSVKEPNYFSFAAGVPAFRGFADDQPGSVRDRRAYDDCRYRNAITDLAAYRGLFREAGRYRCAGESSPTYLYVAEAADRIGQLIPGARFVAILRNPVERTYSQYLHLRRDGHEPLGFADALKAEDSRIRDGWSPTYHYRARGFYGRQLRPYLERFDPSSVKIVFYEDLARQQSKSGIYFWQKGPQEETKTVIDLRNETAASSAATFGGNDPAKNDLAVVRPADVPTSVE